MRDAQAMEAAIKGALWRAMQNEKFIFPIIRNMQDDIVQGYDKKGINTMWEKEERKTFRRLLRVLF